MKKFIVALIVALICNFAAIAHAEEIDPYFAWDIENLDAYRQHDFLLKKLNDNGVVGMRDSMYESIANGKYLEAAKVFGIVEAVQKTAFGTDYFDADFTELTAKLYLAADELDAAERKIDLLTDKANDNLTRIRALNLRADLLNRREKYSEALQAAQTADEILKTAPDEKLRLMNHSRMARAYCGLGDFDKSLEIIKKINKPIIETFGANSVEVLP